MYIQGLIPRTWPRQFRLRQTKRSVVSRSRFLGDTSVPLPEFHGDICKLWGIHQNYLIFTCLIEYSFQEVSVHFSFNFELDVHSFGSRRGKDDSKVVSAIVVVYLTG